MIKYSVGKLGHDISYPKTLGLSAGPEAPVRQKLIRKLADKISKLKDQSQNPHLPKAPVSLGNPQPHYLEGNTAIQVSFSEDQLAWVGGSFCLVAWEFCGSSDLTGAHRSLSTEPESPA